MSLLVTVLAFALPVIFVLVPLAIFLVYSFFSVDQGTIVYAPTLGNYVRFFTDRIFLPVFWNTIVLCVSVAVICILLAYPAAYFLTTLRGRWRYALLMLLLVPLLMSYVTRSTRSAASSASTASSTRRWWQLASCSSRRRFSCST
ncbi:hypothetical protein [Mesorhizobium sp. USDA 4775]